MSEPALSLLAATSWPSPASPERAKIGFLHLASLSPEGDVLSRDDRLAPALRALFGASPFLSDCVFHLAGWLHRQADRPSDMVWTDILADLRTDTRFPIPRDRLVSVLHRTRRRAALWIALCDIGRLWDFDWVTNCLSELAEQSLELAMAWLLHDAAERGEIASEGTDLAKCGWVALGMGKLGGHELNYSSDIDLIILYDPDRAALTGKRTARDLFPRLTRGLVSLLQEPSVDGYAFRVDLRLRPDPASTPPALPVEWAESYYGSMAKTWERAAFIKARPVGGDREAGQTFLHSIRPFLWRRHFDYTAIEDIDTIRKQIDTHQVFERDSLPGRDLKRGPGGIREVEFFVQTQQLIWGGRSPELRTRSTRDVLRVLAAAGHIDSTTEYQMDQAYQELRRVEHRLQMIADQQTHQLPKDAEKLAELACFLGYQDIDAFAQNLNHHLSIVAQTYQKLFQHKRKQSGTQPLADWLGHGEEDAHPGLHERLASMGFSDPILVANSVRSWLAGRFRATRSPRAVRALREMLDAILSSLAATGDPQTAFTRFEDFLAQLPLGVQVFLLFQAHPELLADISNVMGVAPQLAEAVTHDPALFDYFLIRRTYRAGKSIDGQTGAEQPGFRQSVGESLDFETMLDAARHYAREQKFALGLQILDGSLLSRANVSDAGDPLLGQCAAALTELAEDTITVLAGQCARYFAEHEGHGRLYDSGIAVLALGRLGVKEMVPETDLDLIFLYDPLDAVTESDGARRIAPNVYYIRLAQRMITALAAPTAQGRIYEVDMRLRPSGSKGPIANNLLGFASYQREQAWTWEHMALTRARVVYAKDPEFAMRITQICRAVLTIERDQLALVRDVYAMRKRIAGTHRAVSLWDIKRVSGGSIDCAFLLQYLQLAHARQFPDILQHDQLGSLARLRDHGLLSYEDAHAMMRAVVLFHDLASYWGITLGRQGFDEERLGSIYCERMAQALGEASFLALKNRLVETTGRISEMWHHRIGVPAAAQGCGE